MASAKTSSISLGQWETPKDPCWQSCPDWEQRAAHHIHSAGISTGAHMELEVGSQELAAAGPNSDRRGKSWHRCCVLPTQCLCGSLRGWRTRIHYLSCAGNELCPLHPLSTGVVFAVGEMPLLTLPTCQEGVSLIPAGALMVERGQTQFQPCSQSKEPSPAACCSSSALLRAAGTKKISGGFRVRHTHQAPRHPHHPVCCVEMKRSSRGFIQHPGAQD